MKLDTKVIFGFYEKDEAAVNRVYVLTSGLLRLLARGILGDKDLAQDAMMEAYVSTLESKARIYMPKAFVAYLCKATKNAALSMLRKLGKEEVLPEEIEDAGNKPIDAGLLSSLKEELGSPDYEILILHAVEGYTFGEIAAFLELGTPSAVRGRYARAKKKAKQRLGKEGY